MRNDEIKLKKKTQREKDEEEKNVNAKSGFELRERDLILFDKRNGRKNEDEKKKLRTHKYVSNTASACRHLPER